ncbi:hypothetical protein BCR33DRAFT_721438 [Rhizoclosmatium globosum]|uniref:Uncharacterized protein n=1 Tax=Rhizoclosmatium globosum TaxID=329046 RepID=A0A1Y2BTD5_9FUNG|nr:hypothetical protein HDU99_006156 [Rhizoclosmatium hyalinum]ORY37395.1 hypothetical protein BCR33DRAFT_721438 [Rhizoclosmatium globosum]|eukprot:ORY37395.1 hypothetical protein BCR33DRAFT_721438 [Rhizoclosmatium globosum]
MFWTILILLAIAIGIRYVLWQRKYQGQHNPNYESFGEELRGDLMWMVRNAVPMLRMGLERAQDLTADFLTWSRNRRGVGTASAVPRQAAGFRPLRERYLFDEEAAGLRDVDADVVDAEVEVDDMDLRLDLEDDDATVLSFNEEPAAKPLNLGATSITASYAYSSNNSQQANAKLISLLDADGEEFV